MAKKAILIDSENFKRLEEQYDLPEGETEQFKGYYLVADFGDGNKPDCFVSASALDDMYIRGGSLKNNFFEVFKR